MKKLSVLLVFVTLSFIMTSSVYAGGINMKEGLWEITSKIEIPGMPFPMPPTVHSQCITEKEMIPQDKDAEEQGCKMADKKVSKNSVSWTMNCSKDGIDSKSVGKITYNGTTFNGKINVTTGKSAGGRNMNMITVMKGKYIGKCK